MDPYIQLLTEELRERILHATIESKTLKEKLTFKEHLDLCEHVLDMTQQEIQNEFLTEEIRELQGGWDKFKSYSVDALIGLIFKQNIASSLVMSFIFRKVMDPCWRKCLPKFGRPTQRKLCKYECVVDAARTVVAELRGGLSKCNSMPDPVQCQRKLQGEYIKWAKKLQEYTIKLKKVQLDAQKITLKQTVKNATSVARENKQEMIKLVEESKILREKLSFKDHIALYNRVRGL
jgi:hypothetical protein